MNTTGLHLQWPDKDIQTVYPQAVASISHLADLAGFELVLVSVKSFDTHTAVVDLAGHLNPSAQILSLQNGVGNEEILSDSLPLQPIIAGSITLPVAIPQVGTIIVSKNKGGICLAPTSESNDINPVTQALQQAGFNTFIYSSYRSLKWSKLLMNIVSNAGSAILDMPPKEVLSHTNLFDLELAAMRETLQVMRAQNIKAINLPSYPVTLLAVALRYLPNFILRPILQPIMVGARGNKLPSLQLDLRQGRSRSEVDVLNKAVADAANKLNIAAPVNQALSHILNGIVDGSIDWTQYQKKPEVLYNDILKYY